MSQLPVIPCFDGVGTLPDGSLVGFATTRPPFGALAERTVTASTHVQPAAEGIDPTIAVATGSAMTGMAMKTAAGLTPGETVLIQGATGVAGRLAVQIARLLGAGRIVVTGRDEAALTEVVALGADQVSNTAVSDDELQTAYADARGDGFDVVLDFLWGRPTEVLLRALTPESFGFAKPTRLVQIGESAGPELRVRAESLRTSGVEIYGAAKGFTPTSVPAAYQQIVDWTRSGALHYDLEVVPLSEVETAWTRTDLRGKRLVVVP